MRNARFAVLLPLLLLAISPACRREATTAPPPPAPPAPQPQPEAPSPSSTPSSPAAPSPAARLDQLDPRTPLPLLPQMAAHQKQNMRDHLVAVQEIVAGLAASDFAAVERAAGRIGFSQQMGMMCTHMGAGAADFTPAALRFHHTADTIADAARAKDRDAALAALGATLTTCTGCHATWKQRVVDESEWSRLTSTAPPNSAMHGAH